MVIDLLIYVVKVSQAMWVNDDPAEMSLSSISKMNFHFYWVKFHLIWRMIVQCIRNVDM